MTISETKKNELINELTERLDAAIKAKNELEVRKNKVIKEQLELIKLLSNEINKNK